MIEYMYWHTLKIPAKYNDNRLDIFNVGSFFFFSYAILPRLSLIGIIECDFNTYFDSVHRDRNVTSIPMLSKNLVTWYSWPTLERNGSYPAAVAI